MLSQKQGKFRFREDFFYGYRVTQIALKYISKSTQASQKDGKISIENLPSLNNLLNWKKGNHNKMNWRCRDNNRNSMMN